MLNQGDVLQNRYRVASQLGKGGMGAVYRAWDMRLSVPVALKEMIAQPDLESGMLQDLRDQFQQEAVILARLSHPNLVPVTDYFQEGRNVYLVMKFVEGESLGNLIQRTGAVPEQQVVAWMGQLLDALGYCHSQGVIHRDIKPQNIVIRPDGEAVLVDFGLVKLWNPNDPRTRTAVRGIGTPQYSPPEQYDQTSGHTEPRSDLYSLGATMYHALTGQAPPSATMRIAAPEEFVAIRTLVRGISNQTAGVIEKAMELTRVNRWASAEEMAKALGLTIRSWGQPVASDGKTEAISSGRGGTFRMDTAQTSPMGRRRFPLWVLGVVGLLVIGGGGILLALALTGVLDLGSSGRFAASLAPTATSTPTRAPVATAAATLTPLPPPTETASPTATAVASTPQLKVTSTPQTTANEDTPTPTLTPMPSPTPTSGAAASPTATATTGSLPTATATGAVVATGALIDFEQFGTWRRGDQPYGELTQTQAQVKGGKYAASLAYNFPNADDDFVVFMQSRSVSGRPNTFSAWVYGDGSAHFLNLWVEDAAGEVWSVGLGQVGAAGWQQLTGNLAPGLAWPSGHISGPDNGVVDYPVRFYGMVLDRPGSGPLQGQIYIDEIRAWEGEVTAAPAATTTPSTVSQATPTATAAPSGGSTGEMGRVVFTVQTADGYFLYTTDPAWSQMVEIGRTDLGSSTCNGNTVARTLSGQSINLYSGPRCGVTERTDACTSPDGKYKLITNALPEWQHSVLMHDVAVGSDEFVYQGKLNADVGIRWAPTSRWVYFGVNQTINVVAAGGTAYQQVISQYTQDGDVQFSPDGSLLLYLKPVGANPDVFVVGVDGSGERNLTNTAVAAKLCPRWRP